MRQKLVKLFGFAAGKGAGTLGAEDGPEALRERGMVSLLQRHGHRVEDLGDIPGAGRTSLTEPRADLNELPSVLRANQHTADCVQGELQRAPKAFVLVVGGDHSLAIGTLAGLSEQCQRLGLVWIDAHGDYNTPATSPSGNIHGMSVAVACGHGPLELRRIATREPIVREADVHFFGVRDLDVGERKLLEESACTLNEMSEWREAGLIQSVLAAIDVLHAECDHVHLSFDIDVVDATAVPGTGTPVPDGLQPDEALSLLRAISLRDKVHSFELVEYNPHLDVDGKTGELTLNLLDAFMSTDDDATSPAD